LVLDYGKKILKETLLYDIGFGDLTTELIIPDNHTSIGNIIVKEENGIVLCGINIIKEFVEDYGLSVKIFGCDGEFINKNSKIMEITGNTKKILTIERTILNLLMHLCGIATNTYNIVNNVKKINNNIKVACTRKTTPMLSPLEKYAVFIGGGDTHRFRLDDLVLIKDNHIKAVGIENCFKVAKKLSFTKKIEIEVDNIEQLNKVLPYNPDIIMLDNFSHENIEKAVNIINEHNKKNNKNILIEVSGGINSKTILEYAKYNVNIVSLSELITKANSVDLSLNLK